MPRPWLAFLSVGTLSLVVLVFFFLRLQPVRPAQTDDDSTAPQSLTRPTATYVNPSRGPADATVVLVTFGDFQCGACRELAANLETAMRAFPDSVRTVWKDMPNEEAHPLAVRAAVAAHCADRQGKFWEYHDALFARQSYLSEEELSLAAAEIGLDAEPFARCLESNDTLAVVRRDFDEGRALGIVATPTVFLGDESYSGALSVDALTELIQKELIPAP
jgi:protein-disulfide isomerase